MEQCKSCQNFLKAYNEGRQILNDLEPIETNYCFMYRSGIPEDIIKDKEKCPYHLPKEGD